MTRPWDLQLVVFTTLALACLPYCFARGGGEGHAGPEAGSENGVRLGPMHSPILLDGTKLHHSIRTAAVPVYGLDTCIYSCAVTSNCFHRLINGSKVQ